MGINWTHAIVLIVAVVIGFYLGKNKPGLLSSVTGGVVSA